MSTDALVAWLRAQLDADERLAQAAEGNSMFDGTGIVGGNFIEGRRVVVVGSHIATYLASWDPARVLREVEAKRRILDWYETMSWSLVGVGYGKPGSGAVDDLPDLLRLLALPFADRPGFRSEWAP